MADQSCRRPPILQMTSWQCPNLSRGNKYKSKPMKILSSKFSLTQLFIVTTGISLGFAIAPFVKSEVLKPIEELIWPAQFDDITTWQLDSMGRLPSQCRVSHLIKRETPPLTRINSGSLWSSWCRKCDRIERKLSLVSSKLAKNSQSWALALQLRISSFV